MKTLFIGDPHLKINRFDLAKDFLRWVDTVIQQTKPDLVVNLGDTFDTHAVVRSEVMTEFIAHVKSTIKICPYIYLLGNHDQYKPSDSKYHALKHLKSLVKDFHVIDEVVDLYGITFVPYVHNPEEFPKQTLEICVAHQTFKGADFGDITTKDGVDASSIQGAQLIISGHIHKRQRLATGGPEVLYCGSPFSQSSSDINQIKGVSLLDKATLKETFIPCPLPMWKGLKYEITQSFSADDMHEDLMQQLNDTDHWVVEITGPKAEVLGYVESKKGKSLTTGRDVKIKPVFTDKEKKQIRIEAVSLGHIVSEYIDKVYKGSLDKDLLKAESVKLLESADSSSHLV